MWKCDCDLTLQTSPKYTSSTFIAIGKSRQKKQIQKKQEEKKKKEEKKRELSNNINKI